MIIYKSRPPKNTTARLAWDLYIQKHKSFPESIYYSHNYNYQFKGWICEHYIQDVQIKHMNYGGSSNYVFYSSSYLISNKNEIESVEYIEPLSVSIEVQTPYPTDEEILHYHELNEIFTEKVKNLYLSGINLFKARDTVLNDFGCSSIQEYLIINNCNVVSNNSPRNPTSYSYRVLN